MAFLWFAVYCVELLLLLAFLGWLFVTFYLFLVRRRYAHLPSPKMSNFYFGHAPAMIAKLENEGCGELLLKWSAECKHSPLFVIYMIHDPMVICLNPKDIKEILLTSDSVKVEKSKVIYEALASPFGERFFGHGLATEMDHETWKVRRRLYDPSFAKSSLRNLLPAFVECVDSFVERLRSKADGKTPIVLLNEFKALALDAIGKVMYSTDTVDETLSDEDMGLKHVKGNGTLLFLFQHATSGQMNSFRYPFYKYLHPFKAEGHREAIRALRKVARKIIEKRIKAVERGESVPNDILTQILSVEKNANMDDLVDDFATFFVGGYDTTSNTICFALILLLLHPDIMQRVCDEVFDILGEKKSLTSEDLNQMKYLEQVFSETLRLYSTVPQITRYTRVPMALSGYEIPKGTTLFINFDANHRNPEYWEDPEKFDPDRFDPGRPGASPFNYHPFGVGQHSCIGRIFALMEFKVVMSRLLTNFKFQLPDGYELKVNSQLSLLLEPADGAPCVISPLE